MPIFQWNDSIKVSIKAMDDQHIRLVEMINTLHDAMGQGKGSMVMGGLLADLIDYTKTHFAMEEGLMTTHQYTEYGKHKGEHDKLTGQVIEIQEKFTKGKLALSVEVSLFLKDWLIKHIMGTDKLLAAFLNSKGVK